MKHAVLHLSVGLAVLLTIFASPVLAQTPSQVKGVGWKASTKLGPAVATDGNYAYIAWVDSATTDVYFATYAASGGGWYNAQAVGGTTSEGKTWTAEASATPSWGYDGINFYLFWKGKSGTDIWFSEYTDGAWTQQSVVEGTDPSWTAETSAAPAASFVSWPVTLFWKGATGDKVWASNLDDLGPGWDTQSVVNGFETNVAPCPESIPNGGSGVPAIFFKSASNNDIKVYVFSSTNYDVSGKGWVAETTAAPAATVDVDGDDVVFWKGQTGTSIWYSFNLGTPLPGAPSWSHQATVSGAKTNAAPSVANGNGPFIAMMFLAWKNATDDTVWYMDADKLPEASHGARAHKR